MKTYAVLYAPEFRLQATLRHSHELNDSPVALFETMGIKSQVAEMNTYAASSLVQRGMTPTQALARCPELHLLTGNPGHERSAQEALLQTTETLSPYLESTGVGVVTVELPSEHQFTEPEMLERLVRPLRLLGLETRVGLASTPDLAFLAAKYADPVRIVTDTGLFLQPLSIEALAPSGYLASVLHAWGIRTIGQLLKLPRAQVCERLGPEAIKLWAHATGGSIRPLKLVKPQEFFSESVELENHVEMLEPLLFLLRRFLEQITSRLANVYLVAGKLRLILRFEKGPAYERIFTIPQPTREVELLFRMLHTHLENYTSDSAIIALELAVKPVRPNAEQYGLLEKGVRDPHQFAETLARLSALLGSDRVGTPKVELSRRTDAFHLRPYEVIDRKREESPTLLEGVPCFRFRPPVVAKIVLNEIRPAYLYSARTTGQIKDVRGPWLFEGDWWDSRHWSREEWDIATEDGFYRLVHIEEEWFLDGIYG